MRNFPQRQESKIASGGRAGALRETDGPPDERLVKAAQSGDVGAFEALLRRYQDRIFNLAFRLMGSLEEAEDAAQETFLKAHRALPAFRGRSGFYTWLYRIAVNTCHSHRRRASRRRSMEGLSIEAHSEDERPMEAAILSPAPDEPSLALERKSAVQGALSDLGEDLRQVVLLRDMEGFSYAEIADTLSITTAAVRSRLHRARSTLARQLKDVGLP